MPSEYTNAALVQGGTQLLNTGLNYAATAGLNRDDRAFAREQADLQWSRSQEAWNMANEYNTPAAQMARFKQAGLNPHLIYGKGDSGNAGAMKVPEQAKWNWKTPNIQLPEMVSLYQDWRQKNKAIELMNAQEQKLTQETLGRMIANDIQRIKLQYAPEVEKISKEGLEIMNTKRQQEINNLGEQYKKLQEDVRYNIWRNQFIQDNEYAPDAAPSPWKALYWLINKGAKFLKGVPKGFNNPLEW